MSQVDITLTDKDISILLKQLNRRMETYSAMKSILCVDDKQDFYDLANLIMKLKVMGGVK